MISRTMYNKFTMEGKYFSAQHIYTHAGNIRIVPKKKNNVVYVAK